MGCTFNSWELQGAGSSKGCKFCWSVGKNMLFQRPVGQISKVHLENFISSLLIDRLVRWARIVIMYVLSCGCHKFSSVSVRFTTKHNPVKKSLMLKILIRKWGTIKSSMLTKILSKIRERIKQKKYQSSYWINQLGEHT